MMRNLKRQAEDDGQVRKYLSNLIVILSTQGNGVKGFPSALPELLELDLAWLDLFSFSYLQLILLQRHIYVRSQLMEQIPGSYINFEVVRLLNKSERICKNALLLVTA